MNNEELNRQIKYLKHIIKICYEEGTYANFINTQVRANRRLYADENRIAHVDIEDIVKSIGSIDELKPISYSKTDSIEELQDTSHMKKLAKTREPKERKFPGDSGKLVITEVDVNCPMNEKACLVCNARVFCGGVEGTNMIDNSLVNTFASMLERRNND